VPAEGIDGIRALYYKVTVMNVAPEVLALTRSSFAVAPSLCYAKLVAVRSSTEWIAWFTRNAAHRRPIPWETGAQGIAENIHVIGPSLQAWQLGETSDGAHLLAAARNYAAQIDDPQFVDAVRLFILEEQRHGAALGRCLDLAGVPRIRRDWGDSCFRALRYCWPSMEVWATPVVMVECHAMIYYQAVRRATGSPVLQAVCAQILADEIPHLRFQCERLAILHRKRAAWLLALTMLLHRVLFAGITMAVWVAHRHVFQASGTSFSRYWRLAWLRMSRCWRVMSPARYSWDPY
jgi:hypothetical protein